MLSYCVYHVDSTIMSEDYQLERIQLHIAETANVMPFICNINAIVFLLFLPVIY